MWKMDAEDIGHILLTWIRWDDVIKEFTRTKKIIIIPSDRDKKRSWLKKKIYEKKFNRKFRMLSKSLRIISFEGDIKETYSNVPNWGRRRYLPFTGCDVTWID